MRGETKFVIDYFLQYLAFKEAIKTISDKIGKIYFMKKNLDLDEDTELSQIQCNLFYAAISNVEWDIVIKEIEVRK